MPPSAVAEIYDGAASRSSPPERQLVSAAVAKGPLVKKMIACGFMKLNGVVLRKCSQYGVSEMF
jgi:hypothetical protein